FFQHGGFDWKEMDLAVEEAERKGKPVRGASTITNQCARSIFLWQGRSWIRKGLESYYTIWMEALLPKRRILELYANVIEMGRGIYGVEAASQHYFGVSARGLTREQSAMLAAVLPNPKGWDPTKPGRTLRWRQRRILQREGNANSVRLRNPRAVYPKPARRGERRATSAASAIASAPSIGCDWTLPVCRRWNEDVFSPFQDSNQLHRQSPDYCARRIPNAPNSVLDSSGGPDATTKRR